MSDQQMQTVLCSDHDTHSAAMENYMAVMEDHDTHSPAMEAYMAVMEDMDHNMADLKMTGNPDVDFALAMIPHHQGAIDMAKVVLEYGTDPEIRELAGTIIESQGEEILFLNNWLADHSQEFWC